MNALRVIIVDDEHLSRRGVRARLARLPAIEIVAECRDGPSAVQAIRRLTPDLVFLDVQMPELDGFGVVQAIGPHAMPAVIFVTAYDQHALHAFQVHACDFLLKPIDDARFDEAVDHARQRLADRKSGARLAALLSDSATPKAPARLLVPHRGQLMVVDPARVDWIEARGDYVRLHARDEHLLLHESMNSLEGRLDGARFVRIHRSTIVNVSRIASLQPQANREFGVVLHDGTLLKASRSYSDRLRTALGISTKA